MNNLKHHYSSIVSQDLLIKYHYKNPKSLPKFTKLSLSAKLSEDYKKAVLTLFETITLNKPCLTLSKVNSLSLNLRKGQPVGVKITMRKNRLFDFLEIYMVEILPLSKKIIITSNKGKYGHIQFKELIEYPDNAIIFIFLQGTICLDLVIESSGQISALCNGCRLPNNAK
jgi:ribosomal protein L5